MKRGPTLKGYGSALDLAKQAGWLGGGGGGEMQPTQQYTLSEEQPPQTPMPTLSSLPPWVLTAGAFALGGLVVWMMMKASTGGFGDVEEVFDELGFDDGDMGDELAGTPGRRHHRKSRKH